MQKELSKEVQKIINRLEENSKISNQEHKRLMEFLHKILIDQLENQHNQLKRENYKSFSLFSPIFRFTDVLISVFIGLFIAWKEYFLLILLILTLIIKVIIEISYNKYSQDELSKLDKEFLDSLKDLKDKSHLYSTQLKESKKILKVDI